MSNALGTSLSIASSGLVAQSRRIAVVSENVANASSTSKVPGGDAFRRKTIAFEAQVDDLDGPSAVSVAEIGTDQTPFRLEHNPSHPAADADGNVKLPNVDMSIELADMREAARTYQANVQVIKQARELISMTINMLGAQG